MQASATEAAHVGLSTSRRGMGQKYSDREAIPLCAEDHRTDRMSIHSIGADEFFESLGSDRDSVIREYNRRYMLAHPGVRWD